VAFSPVIAEATATAYKGAPSDIQQRIRRVVDVWKERHVFEEPIQAAIETRMEGKLSMTKSQAFILTIEQSLTRLRAAPRPALQVPFLAHHHHRCRLSYLLWQLPSKMSPSCFFPPRQPPAAQIRITTN
jgi:hypothetical protein